MPQRPLSRFSCVCVSYTTRMRLELSAQPGRPVFPLPSASIAPGKRMGEHLNTLRLALAFGAPSHVLQQSTLLIPVLLRHAVSTRSPPPPPGRVRSVNRWSGVTAKVGAPLRSAEFCLELTAVENNCASLHTCVLICMSTRTHATGHIEPCVRTHSQQGSMA